MSGCLNVLMADNAGAAAGPDSVSGLWSWQKADAGTFTDSGLTTPATTDGARLGGWQDQSGNSRHWTQTTAGDRPTLKTGIINGLPVIRGDGANLGDYLNGPDMSALTEGEGFYVMAVVSETSPVSGSNQLWKIGTSGSDSDWPFPGDGGIYDAWGTDTRKSTGNPSASLTAFLLYNVASKSGEWTSRINGTQHFTTATNTAAFSSTPTVFMSVEFPGPAWGGDIAEMIVYDHVLSSGNRSTVNAYIANKYGLTIA